jgi:phage protein D
LKKLLEPNDFQEFIFEILDVRSEMQFNREITVLKSYLTAVENRREKLIEEKSQKEKELEEKRIAAEEEEALKKRPRKIINLEEAIKREKERKERLEAREAEKERLIKKAKEIEAAEREELYGLKEVD